MTDRLSNEHGHDPSEKTSDPSSGAQPDSPAGVPDPSDVPPNEGGTGPDAP